MTLSKEESTLFFKLWLPLLRFSSEAYNLHVDALTNHLGGIDFAAAINVAENIWSDVSIIDEYLSLRKDMTDEEREIISGWKHVIHAPFAIERHLRGGSVFISLEDSRVYLVKGITSSYQEMFGNRPMPVIATASLLPFKGIIITDGLLQVSDVIVGPNYTSGFKDVYMTAKQKKKIIKKLFLLETAP